MTDPTAPTRTASRDIHSLLRSRTSPRAFASTPVPDEAVALLLEAARWAPSCLNEQPWRFVLAPVSDAEAHDRLVDVLLPGNQVWAKDAPLLLLALAKRDFERNGEPNRHALHDVGQAVFALTVQATELGLIVHQMAGVDIERARERFSVPDGFDVVSAIAVGFPGEPEQLSEEVRQKEKRPRTRRPPSELFFHGRFGTPQSDARR